PRPSYARPPAPPEATPAPGERGTAPTRDARPAVVAPAVPLHHRAGEIRRVIDAARPLVDRLLRIRAERPRTARHRAARGDDPLRRLPLLHPGHQRPERIERVRPGASAAVVHVGHQEEAEEGLHALLAAHLAPDLLVVLDGLEGAERMVGPA